MEQSCRCCHVRLFFCWDKSERVHCCRSYPDICCVRPTCCRNLHPEPTSLTLPWLLISWMWSRVFILTRCSGLCGFQKPPSSVEEVGQEVYFSGWSCCIRLTRLFCQQGCDEVLKTSRASFHCVQSVNGALCDQTGETPPVTWVNPKSRGALNEHTSVSVTALVLIIFTNFLTSLNCFSNEVACMVWWQWQYGWWF